MAEHAISFPIGVADFKNLRESGAYYVDKTNLVEDILRASAEVLLIPRPRRFGKTINLSMLRYFLEKTTEDRRALFAGLSIETSPRAQLHFQRYPVISLTFKDVKARSWEQCFAAIRNLLAVLYSDHRYLLESDSLTREEASYFAAILESRASEAEMWMALGKLSRHLADHHGERAVILIDEYDTPIHSGYAAGYYDEAVAFFRNFLSSGLKDNAHLAKGVLTGILRVAKESIFSGLNNLAVYSLLRSEFSTYFGFTENEVAAAAAAVGQPGLMEGMRAWYDGYAFGGEVIYNPWSILNFLDSADKQFRPYWVSTSSNDLIESLVFDGPDGLRPELEELLHGGSIEKPIQEDIALRDLTERPDTLWSLLLYAGYLKAVDVRETDRDLRCRLAIPNREVHRGFSGMVQGWLGSHIGGSSEVAELLRALLRGDARTVEHYLARMVKVSLSYHDVGGDMPERVFHGFIVGLLVNLGESHDVRSNRESGFGRYDVMVLPKNAGQPGVVMELKVIDRARGETEESALVAALSQLRTRDYATELRERGASPIHAVAAVFDGKRVWVESAPAI